MSTRLGKYHLLKQIAQGGMAEVFLAKQRGPAGFEQEVVVKRILPHRAQERAARRAVHSAERYDDRDERRHPLAILH